MVGNALKLIEWLYIQNKDKLYVVKEYKKIRNKKQNGKYWDLINELSLKTKISVDDLHFDMLKHYSPRYEILVPADKEIRGIEYYERKSKIRREDGREYYVYHVYTPSHELKTDEFAILLDGLIQECKQQEIETRSPDEIKREEAMYEFKR